MSAIGFDTSNYTTSIAFFDGNDGVNCSRLLPVKQGELGLRQSDAVFSHTKSLPELSGRLFSHVQNPNVDVIGVSTRPRAVEGSYMPCFMVGYSHAKLLADALGKPLVEVSHQQGHVAAALWSAGRLDLMDQAHLAWHLSGGTTELLLVEPSGERIIRAGILGGSTDISAGQLIDRAGVALEMPFPAGPYVEQAALKSDKNDYFRVKVQGCSFSFSGVQNQFEARIKAGESREDICRFVLLTVAEAILKATRNARKTYPLPVLISGGVSVCSLVQDVFAKEKDLWFAQKGLGGDNAVGTAILASMR